LVLSIGLLPTTASASDAWWEQLLPPMMKGPALVGDNWWQKIPFVRLLHKYDFYEPFVDLLLEPVLGAEPTPPVTKVDIGVPQAGAKLEVLKFTGSVTVEGGDSSMLGNNWVKVRIPVEFRYEVDLTQLKQEDIRYLAQRNLLKVKLPTVRMARVVPDHEGLEVVEKQNPFFRSRASWYSMKERVMKDYLRPNAELLGQEKMAEAQLMARTVVHDFLRRVCTQVRDVEIVVE
jgi:hypothetical protein